MPREPWDFVARAVEVGHPRSMAVHITDPVVEMLQQNFQAEPWKLIKDRAMFLQRWTKRTAELEKAEAELHKSMDPHLESVLAGKHLLVLKEMLESLNDPDRELVQDIEKGFNLCGWMPKSNIFPLGMKRPTQSLESAMKMAKGLNKSIHKQVATVSDPELSAEVWSLTE